MISTIDTPDLKLWYDVLDALPNPVTLSKKVVGDNGSFYDAIIFVNKAFLDIIGYTIEEIPTNREWFKYAYPEEAYQKFVVEKCFNMGENNQDIGFNSPGFPTKIFCKDGIERWFQVTSNTGDPILEKYHTIMFTEVQTPENIILEQQAVTRLLNNELSKQRLAKAAAELSNQSKSEFLATISHELRTPMHGILSFVDIGIKKAEKLSPAKSMEYFGYIKTCADRLLFLVNDLLDLSKLEAGKMEMNFTQKSLRTVAQDCITEQFARLAELDKKVTWHPKTVLGEGIFDSERIAQVITNFLSNAIKNTPTGQDIDLCIENTELNNTDGKRVPALLFSIRDYGVGIPEGELELIFDKFSESSATKTCVEGTGLGLAICKEIITAHFGTVWVENHPEVGAVFKFVIPVVQEKNNFL